MSNAVMVESSVQESRSDRDGRLTLADKATIRKFALAATPDLDVASQDRMSRQQAARTVVHSPARQSLVLSCWVSDHLLEAAVAEALRGHHNDLMRRQRRSAKESAA